MKFLLYKYLLSFKKCKKLRIGFVVPQIKTYNRVIASTRIRAYDIINNFYNDNTYKLELFSKRGKYDIVIFQKKFDKKAYQLAEKLKKKKIKIVLDVNVNYFENRTQMISEKQNQNIINFSKLCDAIIVSSEYIKTFIEEMHINIPVYLIEESINKKYFSTYKKIKPKTKNLIWSGFSVKAKEILLISNVLEKLKQKYNFKLIIIAEKNPNLNIKNIQIEFIKYNEKKITAQLLNGDIFIAPRNLNEKYNLGHSFTKIGVAMALGIPIIASPLPSYINSPAIICNNNVEWYSRLEELLIQENEKTEKLSKKGIQYCKQNLGIDNISTKYESLFSNLLKNEN